MPKVDLHRRNATIHLDVAQIRYGALPRLIIGDHDEIQSLEHSENL